MASAFLLVIGHREGLSWILGSERMAFPRGARSGARSLAPKDQLFLYTTRRCLNNPPHGEGRVIGRATVTSVVASLSTPVVVAGRALPYGCSVSVDSLAPLGLGVPLRTLVDKLDVFSKNPQAWSVWLRRTVVPLSDLDANLLAKPLTSVEQRPGEVLGPYLKWFPRKLKRRTCAHAESFLKVPRVTRHLPVARPHLACPAWI
jgi:hypothetical protein